MIIVKKWTNPNTEKSTYTLQVIKGNTIHAEYNIIDYSSVTQLLKMYRNHSFIMPINVAQKVDLE